MTAANDLCNHYYSLVPRHFLPKCHSGIQSIPSRWKKNVTQGRNDSLMTVWNVTEVNYSKTSSMATAKAGRRNSSLNLDTQSRRVSAQRRERRTTGKGSRGVFPPAPVTGKPSGVLHLGGRMGSLPVLSWPISTAALTWLQHFNISDTHCSSYRQNFHSISN